MATRELQCACSSPSPFTHLAKAPLLTFMQLISILLFAFFLSLALSEPSSHSPVAASSSQIRTLHEQEAELSLTRPFIYETVAASSPAAGSLSEHANSPQKKEALLLEYDGQDHASKEEASISTPAFIYESVAASFSSRSHAEGSHLHDNELPRDAEAAISDDGGKHLHSTAKPSYIYESVAASKSHGSTLLRENAPQEENAFLLDDGIDKKEEPSYIYESVIAASIPSRLPSDGTILHENVPEEENAFLHDDGTKNPIVQKKEDPIKAKPSYIYESVATSIHLEVRDAAIRNTVPQEEKGFLLDDGGKHVEDVQKGAKPITGKQFIYEYVVSQSHVAFHAAGGSHLRNNVAHEENSSLLADDGKHAHAHLEEDLIKDNLSLGNEPMTASSHPGSPTRGSLLRDNVSQPDNAALLLDDGGKQVHESPAAAVTSTQDGGKLLQDNVPQEKYAFLRDDGRRKPISSTHHDEPLLSDITKPKEVKSQSLHEIDLKESLNMQEPSLLHDNVPQGKHAFLVDDGSIKHVEHDSPVASLTEVEEEEHVLHDNASQGEYSSLLDDGGRKGLHSNKLLKDDDIKNHKKSPISHKLRLGRKEHPMTNTRIDDPQEGNLRTVASDSSNNMICKGATANDKEGSHPNEVNLTMVASQARDSKCNSNEEHLRMVVDDSTSKIAHKGDELEGNPPNEEILRMVVGDSSNRMIQSDSSKSMVKEGYGSPSNNLRMVVDDNTSNNMIKKGPFSAGRGRSRSCGPIAAVCDELAHAEHLVHIALYGQLAGPTPVRNTACCGILCVDLDTDLLNCGACGVTCGLLEKACCSGKCTDLNTDSSNCGECGNSCSSCEVGMCGYY